MSIGEIKLIAIAAMLLCVFSVLALAVQEPLKPLERIGIRASEGEGK